MERGKPLSTAGLIRRNRVLWRVLANNPFVVGVRDGDLPRAMLGHWLVQNRYFIEAVFPTACRLLSKAPPEDRGLLVGGVRGLATHLGWYDGEIARRKLDRSAPPTAVTLAYLDFVAAMGLECYPVGIAVLWGQYRTYLDAWSGAKAVAPRFRRVMAEWSSPEYASFVRSLGRAVDRALAAASERQRSRTAELFEQMLHYELAYWVTILEDVPKPRKRARR